MSGRMSAGLASSLHYSEAGFWLQSVSLCACPVPAVPCCPSCPPMAPGAPQRAFAHSPCTPLKPPKAFGHAMEEALA